MARRYNRNDQAEGEERPTSGPVSLAGLIRLQPNRRKITSKNWRPLRLSDFGSDDHNPDDNDSDQDQASAIASDQGSQQGIEPNRVAMRRNRASPFDLPPLQTDMNASSGLTRYEDSMKRSSPYGLSSVHSNIGSEDISPTDTRHKGIDSYVRLFGKQLPDPIHLHVELGEFDGQVLFIGHPNRDVSAHQWSSSSYQWVNVGLYSYTRRRIEGSLASDRLRGSTIPYNTIEYFKAVAEHRENAAWRNSHHDAPKMSDQSNVQHPTALRHPTPNDSEHVASLSGISGSSREQFRTLGQLGQNAYAHASTDRQAPTPDSIRVTHDVLEDPFVSTSEQPHHISPQFHSKESGALVSGSMDFEYIFPARASTVAARISDFDTNVQKQTFWKREQERIEAMHLVTSEDENYSGGGYAGSREPPRRLQPSSARAAYVPVSPEDAHNRQQLKNRLALLGEQAHSAGLSANQRVAVPYAQDLHQQESAVKRVLPPPGFTVANPHRIASTLNANAAPYTAMSAVSAQSRESSSSDTEVDEDMPSQNDYLAANLRFSDPDWRAPGKMSEILNDLSDMPPTPQNWRGPFFSDDKPTTQNPAASLAYQVEWNEKLDNWFRDGQRPARQQEYSRSIMATANADASATNKGLRPQIQHKFEDTPIFVRMYENLSEYVEGNPVNQQREYFTHAWKPARQDQVDTGPHGNTSFFGETHNTSSQHAHILPASRPAPSASKWSGNAWARVYTSEYAAQGGFENTRVESIW